MDNFKKTITKRDMSNSLQILSNALIRTNKEINKCYILYTQRKINSQSFRNV